MYGKAGLLSHHTRLAELARCQHGVLTRAQLHALDVQWTHVRTQIRGGRWREVLPGIVVTHCGPLTTDAERWLAVLAAGPLSALCSWTALDLWGLSGWTRPGVHLVVPRGHHVPTWPGVVVHESRRHGIRDITRRDDLPMHSVDRAGVDAAAWSPSPRTAAGLMAALVQQRLSTPERLRVALDAAGRVRHRRTMFLALFDVEGGAQALSEIDIARLCRSAGLPEPTRQRERRDVNGRRRYLDFEWVLPDGRVVGLEVDGPGHVDTRQWYDDLLRTAELLVPERHHIIRVPASAVRLEPERVTRILSRALAPGPVSMWQRSGVA